jgi:hypothetical protein
MSNGGIPLETKVFPSRSDHLLIYRILDGVRLHPSQPNKIAVGSSYAYDSIN